MLANHLLQVYVCTNLLSVTVFYLFVPETKNRTLEDIDAFFLTANNAFEPVKIAKTTPEGIAEEYDMGKKMNPKGEQMEYAA